jgi:hypothetical protein
MRIAGIKICMPMLPAFSRRYFHLGDRLSIWRTTVFFVRGTVSIPLQPTGSCIVFHPLGFVFHTQAIPGLAFTEIVIEIQTSAHEN